MRAKRRHIGHATRLEDVTDEQLVELWFFSQCDGYTLQPGDSDRVYEMLKQRGVLRLNASRSGYTLRRDDDPEAA